MWNLAAMMRRSHDRRAGWWTAALLGALLALPAELASGESPRTENGSAKASSAKSSSRGGSKARSSRAPSPSRARAQPRGGSRTRRIERARPVRQAPPTNVERPRPRRDAPAVRERQAPRRGSRVDRGGRHDFEGGAPGLRHRRELKDPERAGYHPRKPGRAPRYDRPHGRPGHGDYHRQRHYYRHRHYYGCGHYGFGYDPFAFSFGYYSPFAYWGLGSYYAPAYYAPDVYVVGGGSAASAAAMGALDLDVRPEKAEVYVDGNFVGVADQYDGYPSHLWLEEGTHELAFYMPGYETVFLRYTIYPGVTIDVDVRLRQGESIRPGPPPGLPEGYPAGGDPALPAGDDVGRLAIAATPADAAVYLDGHFVGTAEEIAQLAAGLIVEPGEHLVEVTRPAYASEGTAISVSAGEQIVVKLDLERR